MSFLAVSVDPADGPDVLREYQQTNGYPWAVAPGNPEIVQRYNVMTTMSKYGVDRQGLIAVQGGHTVAGAEEWEQVLEGLAQR